MRASHCSTACRYDEIVVEAIAPAPKGEAAGGYLKLERRVGDYATVGVAVSIDRTRNEITRAGIGLSGVGGSTISADDAAQVLVGRPLTADAIGEAASLAAQAAQPRTDHRGSASYKRHLVSVFTTRLLNGLIRTEVEAA